MTFFLFSFFLVITHFSVSKKVPPRAARLPSPSYATVARTQTSQSTMPKPDWANNSEGIFWLILLYNSFLIPLSQCRKCKILGGGTVNLKYRTSFRHHWRRRYGVP